MSKVSTTPLRLGFFGVLGSGSIGNDGSLDALIGYLREQHPEATLSFLAMGPERLAARYGAPATHLQWFEANANRLPAVPAPILKIVGRVLDPVRSLLWARTVDIVIVGGMGVLETTMPIRPWGFPYGLFWTCVTARMAGRKVAMVGVGANVIHKRFSRALLISAAKLAHYRSYRDQHSMDAMRAMGVDVSADAVYPDLAFAHPVPSAVPDGTGTVGLGLMDYHGNNDERADAPRLHRAYVETMTRFAVWLVDKNRPLRFFTCDPMDSGVIADVITAVRAARPHLDPEMINADPSDTLQHLMTQMAGVDAVVATRYHNVVAAVMMSVPTISISYSRKHDEVMAGAGLDDFCQTARAVDFARLVEQFEELESRRPELTRSMLAANERNAAGVARQFAEVSERVLTT